jgi:hypothetical protein
MEAVAEIDSVDENEQERPAATPHERRRTAQAKGKGRASLEHRQARPRAPSGCGR